MAESSVANPGCLSRIQIFSIPDRNFFHPESRIRIKEFKYFNSKNCFELLEIWSGLFIPDPDLYLLTIPVTEVKKHRIPYRDPQHWQNSFSLYNTRKLWTKFQNRGKHTLFYPSYVYSVGFPSAGLFSVSRHPNYLAEISLWFVFYAFSITAGGG